MLRCEIYEHQIKMKGRNVFFYKIDCIHSPFYIAANFNICKLHSYSYKTFLETIRLLL